MSIISSNKVGIEGDIIDWFKNYVTPYAQPDIRKTENGMFSYIDVNSDVLIHDFPEEKFPDHIVFKKINGDFELSQCHRLNSPVGFPIEITGDFVCRGCEQLDERMIIYVDKCRIWNMQTIDLDNPQSMKAWLNYFLSGRPQEQPLRKIGGKIIIK